MTTPYEVITDRIIGMLDKGVVPWRRPWKVTGTEGANRPTNAKSGKAYRGLNYLILATVGFEYTSNLWLTAKQAIDFGGSVKAGEKGTAVTFWKVFPGTDEKTGKPKTIPMLRYFTVFNVEQTENVKLPKKFQPVAEDTTAEDHEDKTPIEHAEGIVERYIADDGPVLSVKKSSRAFYRPSEDSITVPELDQYDSVEEYYSTLFHELGHSTGHKARCNRTESGHNAFGDEAYSKEELVAEMTSAFLAAECGIDNSTIENSVAYIAGWSKKFREDPKVLIAAASKAQAAADYIMGIPAPVYEKVAA